MSSTLNALVHTLRCEAKDIISVELCPAEGTEFPGFTAGAHIDLHLPNGLVRSYSLSNSSEDRNRYVVGVLRDRASRGGSRSVHDDLRIGKPIRISAPRNHFALEESADYTVLVAGGIGITPLLSMARRLKSCGRQFEVLYFARERGAAAFLDDLYALGMPLHLHFDQEEGGPPDLRSLLAQRATQPGAHYYACGPAPLLRCSAAPLLRCSKHSSKSAPIWAWPKSMSSGSRRWKSRPPKTRCSNTRLNCAKAASCSKHVPGNRCSTLSSLPVSTWNTAAAKAYAARAKHGSWTVFQTTGIPCSALLKKSATKS